MKKPIKFISFYGVVILLAIADSLAITLFIGGIIGCITTHEKPDIVFNLLAVFFGFAFGFFTTWPILKVIYIVEVSEDKIKFRSVYRKYTIDYSQIQDIIRVDGWMGGSLFSLKVEGYPFDAPFYPFCFEHTEKTEKVVQKLRHDLQLKQLDK